MSERQNQAEACAECALRGGATRRDFVTQMFLAAAGSYLAACGDGVIGGPIGPGDTTLPDQLVVQLSAFPALATVGGTARVDGGTSRPVAVTRTGASTFVAVSMICSHQRYKPIGIFSTGFVCPNHGAQFNKVGEWIGGQPTSDLRTYAVVFDGVDTLTIG